MTRARRIAVVALLALLGPAAAAYAEPLAWAVNSRGNLPNNDEVHALWQVDLATGESSYVGWTSFLDMEGLALADDGTLFGADDESNSLVTVSTATGLGIAVGNQRTNFGIALSEVLDLGMTFTCDGRLLVSSDQRETLYEADPDTGLLTPIGAAGSLGAPITDIAAWGGAVYGIGQGLDSSGASDSPNLYAIDPVDGTATEIGPLGAAVSPYANAGLSFDADGQLWALTDRRDGGNPNLFSEVLRIDTETGTASKIADADVVGFESLAIAPTGGCDRGSPAIVPVPALGRSGLLVLGLLLLALGWTLLAPRR